MIFPKALHLKDLIGKKFVSALVAPFENEKQNSSSRFGQIDTLAK